MLLPKLNHSLLCSYLFLYHLKTNVQFIITSTHVKYLCGRMSLQLFARFITFPVKASSNTFIVKIKPLFPFCKQLNSSQQIKTKSKKININKGVTIKKPL